MTAGFSVEVVHQPTRCILVLVGDLDVAAVYDVEAAGARAIDSLGAGELVVDLTAVSFLDCAGVGSLLALRTAATGHGMSVRLVGIPERVLRLLRMLGLDADRDFATQVTAVAGPT
jgi:anti-sigma B factor antagonist